MRAFGFDRQSLTKSARAFGILGFAAAAFMMTPSPAQALPFPPSPRDIHNRVVHDVQHLLEVPRAIHQAHVDALRSFARGASYHAPHPYYHPGYNVPVYPGGRVAYRPYPYSHGAVLIGGGVPVPRIVVSVGPGPYYYGPPPCPPPPPPPVAYGRPYDHRYDNDHGRYEDHDRGDHDRYGDRDNDRYDDEDR